MKKIGRALRTYLITGIVLLLPLAVTIYLLWTAFSLADRAFGSILKAIVGQHLPGVGAILTVTFVIGLGMFARNVVGRRVISFFEQVFTRIPLVSNIYNAVKQLLHAFTTPKDTGFKHVVMIEFPRRGMQSIGFLTNNKPLRLSKEVGDDLVTVFVPTTPNPTTGFFLAVPRDEVIYLDMTLEEGLKMIMSSGIIVPEKDDESASNT